MRQVLSRGVRVRPGPSEGGFGTGVSNALAGGPLWSARRRSAPSGGCVECPTRWRRQAVPRRSWTELKSQRLVEMSSDERAEHDAVDAAAKLAPRWGSASASPGKLPISASGSSPAAWGRASRRSTDSRRAAWERRSRRCSGWPRRSALSCLSSWIRRRRSPRRRRCRAWHAPRAGNWSGVTWGRPQPLRPTSNRFPVLPQEGRHRRLRRQRRPLGEALGAQRGSCRPSAFGLGLAPGAG
jgi:hypothetical protein